MRSSKTYKEIQRTLLILLSLIFLFPTTLICRDIEGAIEIAKGKDLNNRKQIVENLFNIGVDKSLAKLRKKCISQLKYDLTFYIPQNKDSALHGFSKIIFNLDNYNFGHDLAIDFKTTSKTDVGRISVNGRIIKVLLLNEHLIIPQKNLKNGKNIITVHFTTNTSSLNRREDFLYTLLVPDRARTLFPCFEQPDLKANYSLTLSLPEEWEAIGNSKIKKEFAGIAEELGEKIQNSNRNRYKSVKFQETEPLSTYVFSFIAGKLNKSIQYSTDSTISVKSITIYHRSVEERELNQIPTIAKEVFDALKWMEDYTGVKYAFSKYDLILLPGFQFGGMEHTGATLYNDNQLFLQANSTIEQRVRRTQLIAHETAHMWFGDLVTMSDFSEVWVKEVFANFFANLIVRPTHKEINYALNDLSFYKSAYREDRTTAANPIKQNLDNIKYAGLIYGDIIYNKSPIAISLLYNLIGSEKFRESLHNYLLKFKYSNASWEEIISIFKENSKSNEKQIIEWNKRWILQAGMPVAKISNPIYDSGERNVCYDLNGIQRLKTDTLEQAGKRYIIPNCDAKFYGKITLDSTSIAIISENLYSGRKPFDAPEARMASLMMFYENYLNKNIDAAFYAKIISGYLYKEKNLQIFPSLLSYLSTLAYKEGEKKMSTGENIYEYIA